MCYTGVWLNIMFMAFALLAFFGYLLFKANARDQLMMQTSALMGAYAMMRGIAMLSGGFNSEGQMYEWLAYGYILQQPRGFYAYFSLWCLLYLVGQRAQRRMFMIEKFE